MKTKLKFFYIATAIFLLIILTYPIAICMLVFYPKKLGKFVKKIYVNLVLLNWLKALYDEI